MTSEMLDLKDRKILYILSQEARTSPSIIAKQVGLSKDAVKYRIRRMESKEIIHKYITELDTLPLGYISYELFLRFNLPPEKEYLVADYFNSHPNICWSCSISGEWNYFAELMCNSGFEFHAITKDLAEKFKEHLEDYEFYTSAETYRLTQMIDSIYKGKGIDLKGITDASEFPASAKEVVLDYTEKNILGVMAENARLPIYRIAEEAGTTPEIVRYRLNKLRKEGILLRTTPIIYYGILGYDEYILLINMRRLTPDKENALRTKIKSSSSIKYAFRAMGKQCIFALVNTKTLDELEALMKNIRGEFFEIIKSIKYYHITEHQRFVVFTEVLRR